MTSLMNDPFLTSFHGQDKFSSLQADIDPCSTKQDHGIDRYHADFAQKHTGRFDLFVVDEVGVLKVAGVVRHRGGVEEHVPVVSSLELKFLSSHSFFVKFGCLYV